MVVTTLKADRIEVVDSLRGFAVFGILVSHCYYLFFLGDATGTNLLDEEVSILVRLFVNDKFYSLFSFLFGLSFSLMLSRTNDTRGKFTGGSPGDFCC
ncbi:MAG TPA: heparan-alpha-glucosaminide N-acetyltransferase domain-containing protein [Chryseolinea sp.]|nr:heparan-alpha-glucosaminide N-acetyltransferase domain-containing protein [Chryseolinea sp.]